MTNEKDSTTRWAIAGSVAAVAGAVVCCIGPLVLLSLGIGGAGVASLSALEAYRPVFMVAAAASLAVAFYRTYFRHRNDSCGDEACGESEPKWADVVLLWGATLVVGLFFSWPYVSRLGLLN